MKKKLHTKSNETNIFLGLKKTLSFSVFLSAKFKTKLQKHIEFLNIKYDYFCSLVKEIFQTYRYCFRKIILQRKIKSRVVLNKIEGERANNVV